MADSITEANILSQRQRVYFLNSTTKATILVTQTQGLLFEQYHRGKYSFHTDTMFTS